MLEHILYYLRQANNHTHTHWVFIVLSIVYSSLSLPRGSYLISTSLPICNNGYQEH